MKKVSAILLLSACFITISAFRNYASNEAGDELKLYMGEVKLISVNNPTRIAIGNPAVIDVTNVTKNEITISPKSAGNTTLVIWDNYGEQPYSVKVFSENINNIKERIDNILKQLNVPGVYTKAQEDEGKVFLLGKIKAASDKDKIQTALGPLKDKIVDLTTKQDEENVIEIDVQILEIDKGTEDKLGFEWPSTVTLNEVTGSSIATGAAGTYSWGKLFKLGRMNRGNFDLTLDALIQQGKARILSRPRLSCLSGAEAKLLVGGQVPVLSGSVTPGTSTPGSVGATTGASVEYKDYGIVFNIRPVVNDEGKVHLNLSVEVSELGAPVQTSYAFAYTFIKRSAVTELILDDGQTMAIGGLIKQKTVEELQKFPWLGDVPILGTFFRHKDIKTGNDATNREDVELFIALTPRIVTAPKKIAEEKTKKTVKQVSVDEESLSPVAKYSQIIQKRILDNLTYPPEAKESGFQGAVNLGLKLSYQGDLLQVKINKSSGYKVLDDNAAKTAKMLGSYPPFPPTIEEKELWVDVPIIYQLD